MAMIKIGFIFPSSHYLFNPFKGDPHTHLQILTVLDQHFGDKVALSLIDLRGVDRDLAHYRIQECDIYLHSLYTLDYNEQVSIVTELRNRFPKAKHIGGGPHAAVYREECLRTFDVLVLGDGEESITRVVNDFMSSGLKRVYEQDNPIDINRYPYPSWKFLPEATIARRGMMTLKHKEGYDKLLGTTVVFSRGCPFRCSYCAMPQMKTLSPGIRYRDPKLVEEEIEYLKRDYGMEGLNVLDEIGIPLSMEEAVSHLEAIGRTGITWRGQCRVDGVTPDIARLARESGCVAMGLGVESVSQKALNLVRKQIDAEQARTAIRLLKENDIEARIYLIIGLPGEPKDVVEKTWSFIEETNPDLVILSIFSVRPGTEVFDNPGRFGIKWVSTEWDNTMHMFGRYEEEVPTLTFEYEKSAPWEESFSNERIISNYMDLQARLRECGLSSL